MNSWTLEPFGNLADFKNGLNFRAGETGHEIKVLGVGDFKERTKLEQIVDISSIHTEKKIDKSYLLKDGDLVFVRSNGNPALVGRCMQIFTNNEDISFSGFTIRARLKTDKTTPEFISLLMQGGLLKNILKRDGRGTNISNLNQDILSKLQIPIPSKAEQMELLNVFGCWDSAIEKTEALIAAKEKQFEWLMGKLLKSNDTWTPYNLGELFDNRKETKNTDLPLVSITREKGVVPHSETNRKDNSSEDKSKYLRIRPNDIGYNTMRMWQGVSALSGIDGIVSPAYTICIPKKIVDPEFMAFLFKAKPMIHKFYRYSQGLTSDTWNLKFHHFCEVKAEIPAIETQVEIAQILNTAKHEISLLKKTLEQYRSQKRGLMQKLLTGEWQVTSAQVGAEGELQDRTKENVA
jgi:type I restriction enzyme S subunit